MGRVEKEPYRSLLMKIYRRSGLNLQVVVQIVDYAVSMFVTVPILLSLMLLMARP